MTSPNAPLPPPVESLWKSFADVAAKIEPTSTITHLELQKTSKLDTANAFMAAAPVSIGELPSVRINAPSLRDKTPVTADFEVTSVLGEGGMGRVLLARQKSLQRDVALKVLKGEECGREIIDTLLAEAVITGSIEHPSIVPIHALGRDENGLPVLVMKRIDGVSWRHLFENPEHPIWTSLGIDGSDRLEAHLEILMSVCNAVHYAHSRGVVHRDIKLENVMMGGFGEVYLVDWGIALRMADAAKLQENAGEWGSIVGTLAYMAPEMALGDIHLIDARTDVYLLGATLHFLLTRAPRHTGEMPLELLLSARDSAPFDYGPDVPAELASICNRAMHVDPDKRFSSALEFRQSIAIFRRHRGSLVLAAKGYSKLALLERQNDLSLHERRVTMTECRFAFMQALEIWPGNQSAREGLDKLVARMIDYTLAHRNVEEARALLPQLSKDRVDFEKRIDALAVELEKEKAEGLRLQSMARDADLRIGARFQLMIFLIVPICAVIVFVFLSFRDAGRKLHGGELLVTPVLVVLVLVAAFGALRKRITTAISRRAFAFLLLYPFSTLMHRIFAVIQGDSTWSILTVDMAISGLVSIAFAIAILPQLAWVSVSCFAGALAAAFNPAQAPNIFPAVEFFGALLMAIFWKRLVTADETRTT